jgi:hypothetical protein
MKLIGSAKADIPSKKRKKVIRITNAAEDDAAQNKRIFTI